MNITTATVTTPIENGKLIFGFCEENELTISGDGYTIELVDLIPVGGSILVVTNTAPLKRLMYNETEGIWKEFSL